MHQTDAEQKYREQRPVYEAYIARLRGLLEDLLSQSGIPYHVVEGRAKTLSSFVDKLNRSGKEYEDPFAEITDLAGVRIVLFYLDDIEKVTKLIRDNFSIDEKKSVDKRDTMSPDRFGYQSIHLIVNLTPARARLPEWQPFAGLVAEIQVRTVLQHAWAAISHKLQYKREDEVPRMFRRRLNRLSGLLELADDEFDALRNEQTTLKSELTTALRDRELDIEINRDSLLAYLRSNANVRHLTELAQESGADVKEATDKTGWLSDLQGLLDSVGIRSLAELDTLLRDSLEWGKPVLIRLKELHQRLGVMSVPFLVGLILTAYYSEMLKDSLPNIGMFARDLREVQSLITRSSESRRPANSCSRRGRPRG